MGLVNLEINRRRYEVACGDGEEPRLRELAAMVNEKVNDLVASLGNVPESKLLLMTCLLLADEATETRQESGGLAGDPALVERIIALAERVEAIAARLEEA